MSLVRTALIILFLVAFLQNAAAQKRPQSVVKPRGAVAADDGRCSGIGMSVLQQGGNAIDASVAAALCLGVVSPASSGIGDHVRDRPFRLNFQKKASGELKLKGKVGDAGEESDSVSSAQKSLNFADENKRSSPKPLSLVLSEETKKKSWYEIIVEEEEESGKHDKDSEAMTHQGNTGKSNEEVDPHAEKIFEEEDWMVDGENFDVDEDDLMEEDELLYDDDQKEDEIAPSLAPDDSFRRGKAATDLKDASLKVEQPRITHRHPPPGLAPIKMS
ncbi:hypothetical protein Bca101_100956 [Brassica carinata]